MATWNMVAVMTPNVPAWDKTGFYIQPAPADRRIYIFGENSDSFLIFNTLSETLTEVEPGSVNVTIETVTRTYSPRHMIYHNGYVYGWDENEHDDVNHTRKVICILKVNPDTAATSIVMNPWTGDGSACGHQRIYHYDNGGVWEGWNLFLDSGKLTSTGGAIYMAYGLTFPNYVEPGPPVTGSDYTRSKTVLTSYNGEMWQCSYSPPTLDGNHQVSTPWVTPGDDYPMAFMGRILAPFYQDDLLDIKDNWSELLSQANVNYYENTIRHEGHYWRESGGVVYQADLADIAAGWPWPVYNNYAETCRLGAFGYCWGSNNQPLVITRRGAGLNIIKAYYGAVYDDVVHPLDTNPGAEYQGCKLFQGDYAVLADDFGGTEYVVVYKREPKTHYKAVPFGIDINSVDDTVYATASVYPTGNPFLVELQIPSLASGIREFSTGSGWFYPHSCGVNLCYLYGYQGPMTKVIIYSGSPTLSGFGMGNGVLPGLATDAYISGLQTLYSWEPEIFSFSVVEPAAYWLGLSNDEGGTWANEEDTTWPTRSLYRTYLVDPAIVGSGDSNFLGASGIFACPLQLSIDYGALGDRCDGLPAITITDIDAED